MSVKPLLGELTAGRMFFGSWACLLVIAIGHAWAGWAGVLALIFTLWLSVGIAFFVGVVLLAALNSLEED